MTIRDYRKKVEVFDKFTKDKTPEEVETLVNKISRGRPQNFQTKVLEKHRF